MDLLRLNVFTGLVGSTFEVVGEAVCLALVGITEHVKTERNEAFSLFFEGPTAPMFPQGIRKLKHEALGELELFLVPVGRNANGYQYEAVFNHVI